VASEPRGADVDYVRCQLVSRWYLTIGSKGGLPHVTLVAVSLNGVESLGCLLFDRLTSVLATTIPHLTRSLLVTVAPAGPSASFRQVFAREVKSAK